VRSIGGDSVPDAGDASYEGEVREEQAREAENASDTLKEVRLALARIDAGTFGLCENGGEHIDEKRLEAIPWTRYCSAHEAEAAPARPAPRHAVTRRRADRRRVIRRKRRVTGNAQQKRIRVRAR
jgi:RNA polymerase-binding transcription factor DksA